MEQHTVQEFIKNVEALIYYSQISPVEGVRPAKMVDHRTATKQAQEWLHQNCKVIDGEYVYCPSP